MLPRVTAADRLCTGSADEGRRRWSQASIALLASIAFAGPAQSLTPAVSGGDTGVEAAQGASAPDANAAVPPWYTPLPGGRPPQKASQEARSARTLAGAELEGVLRGSMRRRRGSGTTLPDLTENFDLNGTWMMAGKRVPLDGTYVVDGDQFCVEFPRTRVTCRPLLIGKSGAYYTRKRGNAAYAEPVEISIPK